MLFVGENTLCINDVERWHESCPSLGRSVAPPIGDVRLMASKGGDHDRCEIPDGRGPLSVAAVAVCGTPNVSFAQVVSDTLSVSGTGALGPAFAPRLNRSVN